MAIAPLGEGAGHEHDPRHGLRLVRGGRPTGAAPRRTARHAALGAESPLRRVPDREALRRSRADHPTAQPVRSTRPGRPGASGVGATAAHVAMDPARFRTARPSPAVHRRASSVAVRRRAAGLGVVVVALVLLALPLRALGAVTVDGRPTPGAVPAGLAPGSVYVVQAGDTLASIAARVNPAAAPAIARELAVATGASTVVPGEHVVVP
jgi:LysM repeat protein